MAASPPSTRPCPVCRHEAVEPFNADYLRCPECEAVFYFEIPSPAKLTEVYSGGFLKRTKRRLLAPFRKIHHRTRLGYDRTRNGENFAKIVALAGDRPPATFLDIGCNRGFLLEAAKDAGWEVWGMEYSPEQIRPFLNSYPEVAPRVKVGDFGELAPTLPAGHFEVVTAIDVVEHFLEPLGCLREIARVLAPGGAFVFQTPSTRLPDAVECGPAWGELKPAEHMTMFHPENLLALAREAGFGAMTVAPEPFDHPRCNFVGVLTKA